MFLVKETSNEDNLVILDVSLPSCSIQSAPCDEMKQSTDDDVLQRPFYQMLNINPPYALDEATLPRTVYDDNSLSAENNLQINTEMDTEVNLFSLLYL